MTAKRRRGSREGRPPPDIELTATVKAKRLRFGRVPDSAVEFEGDADAQSHSVSERENIPDEVEAQTTYRDLAVRWNCRVTSARTAGR
jgi:hypothetical protein